MAKINEQDVINFLEEKVTTLQAELARAKSTLEAFTGNGSIITAKATGAKRGPKPRVKAVADLMENLVVVPGGAKRGRKPFSTNPSVN